MSGSSVHSCGVIKINAFITSHSLAIAKHAVTLCKMGTAMPIPTTYAHSGKEWFSLPINSSIQITTTLLPKVDQIASARVCFLGLSDVHECLGVH